MNYIGTESLEIKNSNLGNNYAKLNAVKPSATGFPFHPKAEGKKEKAAVAEFIHLSKYGEAFIIAMALVVIAHFCSAV